MKQLAIINMISKIIYMLELCKDCSLTIKNKRTFYCLDCNGAFHEKCVGGLKRGLLTSRKPHPQTDLAPIPWRCPSGARCFKCQLVQQVQTCHSCKAFICKQCDETGDDFGYNLAFCNLIGSDKTPYSPSSRNIQIEKDQLACDDQDIDNPLTLVDNDQSVQNNNNLSVVNHCERGIVKPDAYSCWKVSRFNRNPTNQFKVANSASRLRSYDNDNVFIARSDVAGWGLFANRNFSCDELIIEYKGEVIGRALADHRERLYNSHPTLKTSCYLFGLSNELVIDATKKGNHARFINHSCSPNCISKVTLDLRIGIHAKQAITAGTELFYDYKFSNDDNDSVSGKKAKCQCGSTKCRGFI